MHNSACGGTILNKDFVALFRGNVAESPVNLRLEFVLECDVSKPH